MTGQGLAFVSLVLHHACTLIGRFRIDQRMAKILYSRLVFRFH